MMDSGRESFPSIAQAAFLLLASVLLQYLVVVALHDARYVLALSANQRDAMAMLLANGLLLAAVMHYRRMTYLNLWHPAKASATATALFLVPPVLLLLPIIFLLAEALSYLLVQVFPLSRWEEQMFSKMAAPELAAIVATCVLAPVLEEMLFRGVILRAFLNQYPRGTAIAASALFFGVAHLNIYQLVIAFLFGLLLGWLYERSRSLLPCVALHAAYNAWIVFSELSAEAGAKRSPGDIPVSLWLWSVGAAAVGVVVLRYLVSDRAVVPPETA